MIGRGEGVLRRAVAAPPVEEYMTVTRRTIQSHPMEEVLASVQVLPTIDASVFVLRPGRFK